MGGGLKKWMKYICPRFTPSRVALTGKHSRHIISLAVRFLNTFYVERVIAHRIKIIDHSCFHNHCPAS